MRRARSSSNSLRPSFWVYSSVIVFGHLLHAPQVSRAGPNLPPEALRFHLLERDLDPHRLAEARAAAAERIAGRARDRAGAERHAVRRPHLDLPGGLAARLHDLHGDVYRRRPLAPPSQRVSRLAWENQGPAGDLRPQV